MGRSRERMLIDKEKMIHRNSLSLSLTHTHTQKQTQKDRGDRHQVTSAFSSVTQRPHHPDKLGQYIERVSGLRAHTSR